MKSYRQKGNVLVVTLILLLVFTMLGTASIGDVSLNQRISANYRDGNISFQAAEAVLKEAEEVALGLGATHEWVNFEAACNGDDCFTTTCNGGLCFNGDYPAANDCASNPPSTPLWMDASTWESAGVAAVSALDFSSLSESPRYIIEFMCFIPSDPVNTPNPTSNYPSPEWSYMYRITAYSKGEGSGSISMVQSTYKVDPND